MANMSLTKNPMPSQDPKVRAHNFSEVALGYSEAAAVDEALRSPVDKCGMAIFSFSRRAWVPLPHPGAPVKTKCKPKPF